MMRGIRLLQELFVLLAERLSAFELHTALAFDFWFCLYKGLRAVIDVYHAS